MPDTSKYRLHLHCEGPAGSIAFKDSSTGDMLVTASGNASISTTQSKFGGSALALDGSGDYLRVAAHSNFGFSTGDFTLSVWVYMTADPTTDAQLFDFRTASAQNGLFYIEGTNQRLTYYNGTVYGATGSSVPLNTWTHIAFVKSSGTLTAYLNGVPQWNTTASTDFGTATRQLTIGANFSNTNGFTGYFDEILITREVLYTADFSATLPSAPYQDAPVSVVDPYFSNVSLLLPMGGAEAGTVFNDRSINRKTITRTAATTAGVGMFGSYAGSFNGSSSLVVTNTAELQFGSGDFTIEGWFWTASNTTAQHLIDKRVGTPANGLAIYLWTDGKIYFMAGDTTWTVNLSTPFTASVWHHFAMVRSGTTYTAYLDGTLVGTVTWSGTINFDTANIVIGRSAGAAQGLSGYMQDVRITTGIARTITVPTAPYYIGLPPVTDTSFQNVALLVNGDGAQGGIPIDQAPTKKVLTPVGTASLARYDSKTGPSSMVFSGSGAYFTVPDHADFTFGAGDFTIEAWIKPTAYAALNGGQYASVIITKDVSGSREWDVNISGTASSFTALNFTGFSSGNTANTVTATTTFTLSVWAHIAVARVGNLIYLFKDGVLLNAGGTAFTATIQDTTTAVKIGAHVYDATYLRYLTGYIDSLRVTKGVGRYTTTFTAPNYILDTTGAELYTKTAGISLQVFDDYQIVSTISLETRDRYTLNKTVSLQVVEKYSLPKTISLQVFQKYTLANTVSLQVIEKYSLSKPISLMVFGDSLYNLAKTLSFTVYAKYSKSATISTQVTTRVMTSGSGGGAINSGAINGGAINSSGISTYELTRIGFPLQIKIAIQLHATISLQTFAYTNKVSAGIILLTYPSYSLTKTLSVQVKLPAFRVASTMQIKMYEKFRLTATASLQIYPAFASGTGGQGVGQVVQPPTNHSQNWSLKVLLGGVDVSARLTGELNVDAEESSAVIATFSLKPASGLLDPYSWVRSPVEIYYVAKNTSNVVVGTYKIFQGIVDTPIYDIVSRVTEFTCTDDLQNVVMRLSHSSIDAITPNAIWSKFVFDETANSWDYLHNRMETYPYAIGLDVNGTLKAYNYQAANILYEFGANVVTEGSISLTLANTREITNQYNVSLESQFSQYRETVVKMKWLDERYDHYYPDWWLCLANMPCDAVSGMGAKFVTDPLFRIQPKDHTVRANGGTWVQMNPGVDLTLVEMIATFSKRFTQNINEKRVVTVQDSNSIRQLRVLEQDLSSSISVEYNTVVDETFNGAVQNDKWLCSASDRLAAARATDTWELYDLSHWTGDGAGAVYSAYPRFPISYETWASTGGLIDDINDYRFRLDGDGVIDYSASGFNSPGGAPPGEYLFDFDDFIINGNKAERVGATNTLIAQAKQSILASHRQNRIGFATHINPFLLRGQTLRLNLPTLVATGVAYQVTHHFSIDQGTALTNITLAVSSSKALGISDAVYTGIRLKSSISIRVSDTTEISGLPVNQSSISYDLHLKTFYDGADKAAYVFDGTHWGGFFSSSIYDQSKVQEFTMQFPTIANENTDNTEITVQNDTIDVHVPNDELYLIA